MASMAANAFNPAINMQPGCFSLVSIRSNSAVDRPTLSIIIVHFNTPEITGACVASLTNVLAQSQLDGRYEIVVLDNRSEINNFQFLSENLSEIGNPKVKLVRNSLNAGFGLGCMLALNYSAGEFVAFVNSDTQFDEDCFLPLIDYLRAHPNVGVITPQHRNVDGSPHRSFGTFDTLTARLFGPRLAARLTAKSTTADVAPDQPRDIDFPFGSFMLFRLSVLAEVGGFDPNIFLFYEEMDVCLRMRKLGYSAVFYPGVGFRHIGQASLDKAVTTKQESDLSLLYVMRKNHSYPYYLAFFLLKFVSYMLKSIYSPKYRPLFRQLLTSGPPQAHSARTRQKCNYDYIND